MLIGICGLIGAGKDTIANHLVQNYNYERYSWATPLKDITATLFGWDRDMLEGTTPEQRTQREVPDEWWSKKLDRTWSPRFALQYMGTEVMRDALHTDIWVLAGQRRIAGKTNVVIPDTRFPNEIAAIREIGGQIWNVVRGKNPEWYDDLSEWKQQQDPSNIELHLRDYMANRWPNVHPSEYSWHGTAFDATLVNNGSISDLTAAVDSVIRH